MSMTAALSPEHMSPEQTVWQALEAVKDPEIPVVSIVEMGMVRGVNVGEGSVCVQFTPTFSGCPALHTIRADIQATLAPLGLGAVQVDTVISPPWSSGDITPAARHKLEVYGIAPPAPAAGSDGPIALEPAPLPCPRCGSLDTRVTATFGSALCKRMYVCGNCKEPFEGFKSV